jgi:hypothetical protein
MSKDIDQGGAVVLHQEQPPQPVAVPTTEVMGVASIFDIEPRQFKAGLKRRKTNRDALMEWIKEALVEGTDWGRLHVVKRDQCNKGKYCDNPYHFSKPSLWKPGAEKIVGMMNLRAEYPAADEWLKKILKGDQLDQIGFVCNLVNKDGAIVSSGVGMRRLADDGDANKAFKMAKKSALIDAVLGAGGLSEVFTQDVEDMDPDKIGAQDPYNPSEEPSGQHFANKPSNPISTHCPIGKEWKGKLWSEVDKGFLSWIIMKVDDKPELVQAATAELGKRGDPTQESADREIDERIENSTKRLGDYARELTLATNIDEILELKAQIPEEFEPSLRIFIATRERELGPK